MRGELPGLPSPHPLGAALPGVYAEDDYVQRFTAGLDEVLAPVFVVLDCFDAYLDPRLAPADFLRWLAWWVATDSNGTLSRGDPDDPVDEVSAPVDADQVAEAARLSRWRGTAYGATRRLTQLAGHEVSVRDTGGCAWSETPGAELPGGPENEVLVAVARSSGVDPYWLGQAAAREVPAHCRVVVRLR